MERRSHLDRKTPLKPGAPPKRKTPLEGKRKAPLGSPRRTSAATNSELNKICDELVRAIARRRGRMPDGLDFEDWIKNGPYPEPYTCQRCGGRKGDFVRPLLAEEYRDNGRPIIVQGSHIISVSYKRVAWDLRNLLCMCLKCHDWLHNWPQNALEFHMNTITPETWWKLHYISIDNSGQRTDRQLVLAGLHTEALRLGLELTKGGRIKQ